MDFSEIKNNALKIREAYNKQAASKGKEAWNIDNIALGFVGDVGQLLKLVQANQGVREIPDARQKLEHELADCLWSIIILAEEFNIDLETSFSNLTNELKKKIGTK